MKQVKSQYIPCGQRPMKGLRKMVKDAGMLLPLGPARVGRR